MSVLSNILENFQCELIYQFGIGNNLRYYKVMTMFIPDKWSLHRSCFFHVFTACETTSSFYNHSKLKFFYVWIKYSEKDDVINLFNGLCNESLHITDTHLNILEKFVLSVYYPKQSSFKCIDQERMDTFNPTPNSNLRSIPFSRKVLKNTPSELVYKVVCCGKKARKG